MPISSLLFPSYKMYFKHDPREDFKSERANNNNKKMSFLFQFVLLLSKLEMPRKFPKSGGGGRGKQAGP